MDDRLHILVDYEDDYMNPLIHAAITRYLPKNSFRLVSSLEEIPPKSRWLQYAAYESLDFERSLASEACLINAYIIRKALIRKHFLSQVIAAWCIKSPTTPLKRNFKPGVDFELDYAEFLDDALLEAFELTASFERNASKEPQDREWWLLKPSMSDRGQGIRLFSTEDELREIFEAWEADAPDSDEDEDEDEENLPVSEADDTNANDEKDYIMTSQLRHFLAQPYIDSPLLIPDAPFNNRKFHIRTYVVVHGALKVYVYSNMLALFASESYIPPWKTNTSQSPSPENSKATEEDLLSRFRNIHLTNTCIQTNNTQPSTNSPNPVHLLSDLPLPQEIHQEMYTQICTTTAELFRAALAYPTHFQPLPNSFEVFGLDFLVSQKSDVERNTKTNGEDDETKHTNSKSENKQTNQIEESLQNKRKEPETRKEEIHVSLLEVNAFPDFAQTGEKLQNLVVQGLLDEIISRIVAPHFELPIIHADELPIIHADEIPTTNADADKMGIDNGEGIKEEKARLEKVLDFNMHRA